MQRDAIQAENKVRHLPFPNRVRTTLIANVQKAMRPANFQIPGEGNMPCGLPPLWNQDKKKSTSNTVARLASDKAIAPEYSLHWDTRVSSAPRKYRRHAAASRVPGTRKSIIVTISIVVPPD